MKRGWALTQEEFDALLAWLEPDRDRAGEKYEDVRRKLIKIFACRACPIAEELADETINRVASKVALIAPDYSGEPLRYFLGVAKLVHLEHVDHISKVSLAPLLDNQPSALPNPLAAMMEDERTIQYRCLDKCMEYLSLEDRKLALEYHEGQKQARINNRKKMAASLGVTAGTLRLRAHRIRAKLEQCTAKCLEDFAEPAPGC
ncbi:MAG TPA: hypothetical protein VJX67_17775 [Blastocatellia bacterium]|nr:hypothetical protein [Blastocatellia bacterium]